MLPAPHEVTLEGHLDHVTSYTLATGRVLPVLTCRRGTCAAARSAAGGSRDHERPIRLRGRLSIRGSASLAPPLFNCNPHHTPTDKTRHKIARPQRAHAIEAHAHERMRARALGRLAPQTSTLPAARCPRPAAVVRQTAGTVISLLPGPRPTLSTLIDYQMHTHA